MTNTSPNSALDISFGQQMKQMPIYVCTVILLTPVLGGCQKDSHGQPQAEQTNSIRDSLLSCVEDWTSFTASQDWSGVVSFMHPEIIEMAGGAERMVNSLESIGMGEFMVVEEVSAELISDIIEVDGKLTAEIKTYVKFKINSEHFTKAVAQVVEDNSFDSIDSIEYMIATSLDDGKSWKFLQSDAASRWMLEKVEPKLAHIFPTREKQASVNGNNFSMQEVLLKMSNLDN